MKQQLVREENRAGNPATNATVACTTVDPPCTSRSLSIQSPGRNVDFVANTGKNYRVLDGPSKKTKRIKGKLRGTGGSPPTSINVGPREEVILLRAKV